MTDGAPVANVIPLHEGSVVPSGHVPNPRLIDMLEKVMEAAQSGQIQGAMVVLHYHDNCAATWQAGVVGGFTMLGAVTAAQHDLALIVNDRT